MGLVQKTGITRGAGKQDGQNDGRDEPWPGKNAAAEQSATKGSQEQDPVVLPSALISEGRIGGNRIKTVFGQPSRLSHLVVAYLVLADVAGFVAICFHPYWIDNGAEEFIPFSERWSWAILDAAVFGVVFARGCSLAIPFSVYATFATYAPAAFAIQAPNHARSEPLKGASLRILLSPAAAVVAKWTARAAPSAGQGRVERGPADEKEHQPSQVPAA